MIFALGAFDGFHLGHQRLLETAKERAAKAGTEWGVITFEGHPQLVFNKDTFKLLFTPEERDMLIKYLGIPVADKVPFNITLADMLPADFLDHIAKRISIEGLVIGENFRFGRARIGTPELLAELCEERGWSLDVIGSYRLNGGIVSSTSVREAVLRGQVESACEMLGYPFMIQSKVIKGDGRGRVLGFPTANLSVRPNKIYPARGSYAGISHINGKWYPVALNIGYNPTFEGSRGLHCEAHIVGFDGDLYEKTITLHIVSRNREEMKFAGADALVQQLKKDIRHAKAKAAEYIKNNGEFVEKFGRIFDI
ncbi:MAG: riboflavin biosynthesis protein RibF [Synergistaceae bacterium]|jgi:riboflavin kinase/FMN adenylyltransferase|nr:riboflavin biosynthesis protein RibF [Synergistaceae bacterium]MBP9975534.1 riboflavin biosynthesis protein RibF [Synergistaceae bacterium]